MPSNRRSPISRPPITPVPMKTCSAISITLLGSRDKITLTLNNDPAYSQIANRTGLPDYFASVGQGYGYAGHLSAAQAAAEGIASQQADGQDINQRDLNQFAVFNWQHTINPTTTSNVSVGYTKSNLNLTNNNPAYQSVLAAARQLD